MKMRLLRRACILNFNQYMKDVFAEKQSLDDHLKDMGVRPTQLTACVFLPKCSNHALHPMNG